MTNSTLYSLLQTVHANQTQIIIPDLRALASDLATLAAALENLKSDLANDLTALKSDLIGELAILSAKLDQISAQVTGPETGDLNLDTATITPKE